MAIKVPESLRAEYRAIDHETVIAWMHFDGDKWSIVQRPKTAADIRREKRAEKRFEVEQWIEPSTIIKARQVEEEKQDAKTMAKAHKKLTKLFMRAHGH